MKSDVLRRCHDMAPHLAVPFATCRVLEKQCELRPQLFGHTKEKKKQSLTFLSWFWLPKSAVPKSADSFDMPDVICWLNHQQTWWELAVAPELAFSESWCRGIMSRPVLQEVVQRWSRGGISLGCPKDFDPDLRP